MIKFFVRRFIKDYDKPENKKVRENYCVLGGVLGAVCNIILFLVKLLIGLAMNSIAVMSDAFNNLSDMGSCIVAIIGAKMSNRLPDKEHPYGHGRFEYISSLIVSFIIMIVGFELLKTSFGKILHPEELSLSVVMIIILALSLLVKLWMYCAYSYIGKVINSSVMRATARDSINDVISTGAVTAATVVGYFLPFPIDGIVGLIVAVYIIYGGFKIAKETIDLLLGTPPSEELISAIGGEVMNHEEICGIHDLIVHDYGPGRIFASVHAEVPDDSDFVHVHEIIDSIERSVLNSMGVQLVIHMDPVTVNNERVDSLKELIRGIAKSVDESCDIHDFRITDGEENINAIFDIIIRDKYKPEEREAVVNEIKRRTAEQDPRLNLVITVDEVFA